MNLCSGCGADFASIAAFDKHRVGVYAYAFREGIDRDPPVFDGRRCMDSDEMRALGMELGQHDRWTLVADAERISAWAARRAA